MLVAGGGSAETNRLLDVKQELPSAWLPFEGTSAVSAGGSEAGRVVQAQRTLQAAPTAGLDVLPIGDLDFRVREMIPAENRIEPGPVRAPAGKLCRAIVAAGRRAGLAHSDRRRSPNR